jgi:predicted nicotinamide N-methyase
VAQSSPSRWTSLKIADETFQLMNMDHPEVEERILQEMRQGVAVYYDRRWGATEIFGRWLLEHREWMEGKRVLALGAGVGLETVILGRFCRDLFVNDLAPVSLELCLEQLKQNGIEGATALPGKFEEISLPEVDLVVGCFLIYTAETRHAMLRFAERFSGPVLLVNEGLTDFRRFLEGLPRPWETLFVEDSAHGILLPGR